MKSFKTFILIIIAFPFVSCENDINNNSIFFGGQIINPSSNYLILHKNNSTIDCLLLDSNNQFKKNFENFNHLGIEPSKNVCDISRSKRLKVVNSFFTKKFSLTLLLLKTLLTTNFKCLIFYAY